MVQVKRTFAAGKMNKSVDERLLPPGEYVDAQNLRLGSTEDTEIGSIEITRGNTKITTLQFNNTELSDSAVCIGSIPDNESETIYWFVHDPAFTGAVSGGVVTTTILDLVVSFNDNTGQISYHLVSVQEGTANRSTLNFSPQFVITGVNLVDDLLLWTDDRNPPRCINVNRAYGAPTISGGNVISTDNFSAEEIRVIKRPPTYAPTVSLSSGPDEIDFLEERFISFAYRYRYADGEYSATSQFSNPAFIPKPFAFSPQSFLNEGMVNNFNLANITFDTGGELVTGIELLWKDNDNSIIKIMERISKDNIADNIFLSRQFDTSKILTVLPDSEILRLYDNVPRFAKAQTLMGNRLVYGNYVENYDLKNADEPNSPETRIDYQCSVQSDIIGEADLTTGASFGPFTYNIGPAPETVANAQFTLDLSSVASTLLAGSVLSFSIESLSGFNQQILGGTTATNPQATIAQAVPPTPFTIEFDYTLPLDFGGVADLVASPNFLAAIGTLGAQPMATADLGSSLTDLWNQNVPEGFTTTLSPYQPAQPPFVTNFGLYKVDYGVDAYGQGIQVSSTGDTINFTFPAIRYCQTPNDTTDDSKSYLHYYRIKEVDVFFTTPAAPPSLHSNRGYEVGIVYMDAFKRATTAFTSLNNAVHIGCSSSDTQNRIRVEIPTTQIAPWWAQSYKFCLKPSATTYETIFANQVFQEPGSSDAYILVEGENARKVEEGTRLIVKADMSGPLDECRYITVLEKSAQPKGFLTIPIDPSDPDGPTTSVPAGVYIKIKASGVDLTVPDNAITTTGWQSKTRSGSGCPVLKLGPSAFNEYDSTTNTYGAPIPLPAGTRVRIKLKFKRQGAHGGGGYCERRIYKYEPSDFIVGDTYDSIIDWWNAEDIGSVIEANSGEATVGNDGACDISNTYINITTDNEDALNGNGEECVNYYQWFQDSGNQNIRLLISGTEACGTRPKKRSQVSGEITIFRAVNLLIFETIPTDGLPDVWFEGADNYPIGANGNHLSGTAPGDQDQDIAAGTPALILLSNYNCYCFGNGCESYTIRDSAKGDSFALGNRVTSTASQDYGRAERYADLTYSGVYNDFSNINKLNEFNLGLLNFKPLEDSFGPVQKLVGRKSDILVLQEDKISYVLSGKNLLSDSTGGGAVTATPVVLGTQIARLEEYGISKNPESYAEYGYNKFFSDEKRGAIIKLQGGSHSTEQLEVISEYGMRSFFRDLFIAESNEIKLGGYDPYMNEYVFSNIDRNLPSEVPPIACGATFNYQFNTDTITFEVELGTTVGVVTVETEAIVDVIIAIYNGVTYAAAATNFLSFTKTSQNPTTATISLVSYSLLNVTFLVQCPVPTPLIIRRLVVNSPQYAIPSPERVHNQLTYTAGSFVSPVFPDNSTTPDFLLNMPDGFLGNVGAYVVSVCDSLTGSQGEDQFPTDGSTITVRSTQVLATDNFVFDTTRHRLGFFRTNTAFGLNPCTSYANAQTILANATYPALNATVTTPSEVVNSASGTMPANTGFGGTEELYLIYDYRVSTAIDLCHFPSATEDPANIDQVCCQCSCPAGQTSSYTISTNSVQNTGNGALISFTYTDTSGVTQTQVLTPGVPVTICVSAAGAYPTVLAGYENLVAIILNNCNVCT